MERKFIGSFNPLDNPTYDVRIPVGPWSKFLVRYSGTTASGETAVLTDFGTVTLSRSGKPKQTWDVDFMNQYDNQKLGYVRTVSGSAATAEDVEAWVPLGLPGVPNIMNFITNEEGVLKFSVSSTFATKFASATDTKVEVWGYIDRLTAETYELLIEQWNVTVNGATTLPQIITNNIAGFYIDDQGSSILTSLNATLDGQNVLDNIAKSILLDDTNANNLLSASQNLIEVNFVRNGNLNYARNNTANLSWYLSGSGSVKNTVLRINFELSRSAMASQVSKAQATAQAKAIK